jgi:predicted nuclease with TOPRIM domain
MVTDQNHSSDSTPTEQEVIRYTEKLAQIFGLDKQNAEVYSVLSGENRALKKQLEDYHSQYNTLEKRVERLEKDVGSLEDELENLDEYVVEDLDECVDRETVVDLIHEIVPSLVNEKSKDSAYSSESLARQRRRMRPRKVKRLVV